MTKVVLSSEEKIAQLIPQRPPFVLVDTIYDHDERTIISGFTIPSNHVLVDETHLSESGIIEHFAQTIALHQGYDFFLRNLPAPVGYIGSIKDVEIFKLPEIGKEIKTKISILQQIMGVTMVSGEVYLENEIIAKAEMRTIIAKDFE